MLTDGCIMDMPETSEAIVKVSKLPQTNWTMKSNFSIARQNLDGDNYFILLILTDGVITDMPQTSEAIVQVGQVS